MNIEKGKFYYYRIGNKDQQIYQCEKLWRDPDGQFIGRFIQLTDTHHCNALGSKHNLNEIEMKNYLFEIGDIDNAFSCYEAHQKIDPAFSETPDTETLEYWQGIAATKNKS